MQNQVRRERIKTYLNKWKTNSYKESIEQGRKRPLDTPKRMIKRREREGMREKER